MCSLTWFSLWLFPSSWISLDRCSLLSSLPSTVSFSLEWTSPWPLGTWSVSVFPACGFIGARFRLVASSISSRSIGSGQASMSRDGRQQPLLLPLRGLQPNPVEDRSRCELIHQQTLLRDERGIQIHSTSIFLRFLFHLIRNIVLLTFHIRFKFQSFQTLHDLPHFRGTRIQPGIVGKPPFDASDAVVGQGIHEPSGCLEVQHMLAAFPVDREHFRCHRANGSDDIIVQVQEQLHAT